ncbi:hypothetical protein ACFPRL_16950 [Pseudoclavibacter helvolus]
MACTCCSLSCSTGAGASAPSRPNPTPLLTPRPPGKGPEHARTSGSSFRGKQRTRDPRDRGC